AADLEGLDRALGNDEPAAEGVAGGVEDQGAGAGLGKWRGGAAGGSGVIEVRPDVRDAAGDGAGLAGGDIESGGAGEEKGGARGKPGRGGLLRVIAGRRGPAGAGSEGAGVGADIVDGKGCASADEDVCAQGCTAAAQNVIDVDATAVTVSTEGT